MSFYNWLCRCFTAPPQKVKKLPPSSEPSKITLVLDLDETLIHASFEPLLDYDFRLVISIDSTDRTVYVRKRPKLDAFLLLCGELFEVVIFTASLQEYANPIIDYIGSYSVVSYRLYRQHCSLVSNKLVKDLSTLNRPMSRILIVDVRVI